MSNAPGIWRLFGRGEEKTGGVRVESFSGHQPAHYFLALGSEICVYDADRHHSIRKFRKLTENECLADMYAALTWFLSTYDRRDVAADARARAPLTRARNLGPAAA